MDFNKIAKDVVARKQNIINCIKDQFDNCISYDFKMTNELDYDYDSTHSNILVYKDTGRITITLNITHDV